MVGGRLCAQDNNGDDTDASERLLNELIREGAVGTMAILFALLFKVDVFGNFHVDLRDFSLAMRLSLPVLLVDAILLLPPYAPALPNTDAGLEAREGSTSPPAISSKPTGLNYVLAVLQQNQQDSISQYPYQGLPAGRQLLAVGLSCLTEEMLARAVILTLYTRYLVEQFADDFRLNVVAGGTGAPELLDFGLKQVTLDEQLALKSLAGAVMTAFVVAQWIVRVASSAQPAVGGPSITPGSILEAQQHALARLLPRKDSGAMQDGSSKPDERPGEVVGGVGSARQDSAQPNAGEGELAARGVGAGPGSSKNATVGEQYPVACKVIQGSRAVLEFVTLTGIFALTDNLAASLLGSFVVSFLVVQYQGFYRDRMAMR